ncbi:Transcriptional regulator, AraC family [Fulvivirga imtechensis AK7]|uniref:Transcriptional regulator, AraC family n=1 Tax=Fulvivirga imtechensis AK7 TaxID=1237149 RepID=L8JH48_9BACT|nr:helix-turn-helix domain-containing protein [Fulvivirga imtechensis]ELR68150.1 Transcriptional regulator, AraC family [Fulvivirga imtechensis AK7]
MIIPNLRQLYCPVQPTVKRAGEKVVYAEFLPDPRLQPFIHCYWELKTLHPLAAPFCYKVVADGCIDIFFELDNSQNNFIMGFCKKHMEFTLDNTFHYIGIRFLPSVFPRLFKISAVELSNRTENLSDVVPSLSRYISSRFSPRCEKPIKSLLDDYFLPIIMKVDLLTDHRFDNAVNIILNQSDAVAIESDLDTGLSPRQLRRVFQFYIGDTAKTFSKVVRFQKVLSSMSIQRLSHSKACYEAGYYDQAHFIKDFKTLYGVTPTQAVDR